MTISIRGKTAIVTGAAHGIGLAIARHFLEAGANVMFADVDEEGLARELGTDGDGEGSAARYFAGDIRERLTMANLLSATIDAFDRVDILVNASRLVRELAPDEIADAAVEEMLDVNTLAPMRLSELVARRMIRQAEEEESEAETIGTIINVTAGADARLRRGQLGFSVSCAANRQMTRALAMAMAPRRIRVNGIAFGSVMSSRLQALLADDPDLRDRMIRSTPLGRIGRPEEVAEAAQFLASEASSFMVGEIVTIDGGRSLVDPVDVAGQ